jgi:phosphoglycolate phosphatase-like HAD superfamily hydrolase
VARAAIVDVDGTLVDTNYHHALAWYRSFREHDVTVPLWKLHRHVGMGGDKYVAAVAGDDVEEELGDDLRGRWEKLFGDVIDEIAPLPGARDLLVALKREGLAVVIASSSIQDHLDVFLDLLDAREIVDDWTMKDDVEQSKPEPDLVCVALDKAGTDDAFMIGDTPWDVESARKAGIPTLCVLTGGFARSELEHAGAVAVHESVAEIAASLDRALMPVS